MVVMLGRQHNGQEQYCPCIASAAWRGEEEEEEVEKKRRRTRTNEKKTKSQQVN